MPDTEKQFLADFNPNSGIVHRVCNAYFTDPELRRDVFQEIVYQLWKSYPSFNRESKFTTWMYKVALNTAITFNRKRSRSPEVTRLNDSSEKIAEHNESLLEEERITKLYAVIHSLSAGDKAIILLYLEDHSYEEIAAVTGLTKTNVSVKLVRIKKALEEKLKSHL